MPTFDIQIQITSLPIPVGCHQQMNQNRSLILYITFITYNRLIFLRGCAVTAINNMGAQSSLLILRATASLPFFHLPLAGQLLALCERWCRRFGGQKNASRWGFSKLPIRTMFDKNVVGISVFWYHVLPCYLVHVY